MDKFNTLRTLIYAVHPSETSFKTVEEVPDYIIQVGPYALLLWILESLFMWFYKKKQVRLNDTVVSGSQGILYQITRIMTKSWQLAAYIYVYSNWRLVDLPWDSLWTWWMSVLSVDLLYYWQHRACHEVNFLWAAHQVHHSSEEYNLSTAMRQSAILNILLIGTSLPLALVIPPSAFLVHVELNTLYQTWIHTESIRSIGPLEYIMNTASHHRVHHGRNRYCIDKNYGGVLIIWDRLFGTFEAESKEVIYGLAHPIQSFETLHVQFDCYVQLWKRFWTIEGIGNKLSVLFKGPGWYPSMPRLGSIEDIPDVQDPAQVQKYDPHVPSWCKVYAFFHMILMIPAVIELSERQNDLPITLFFGVAIYVTFTASTFGILLEGRSYAPILEIIRCLLYVAVDYFYIPFTWLATPDKICQILLAVIRLVYLMSGIFWLQYIMKSISLTCLFKTTKID